MPHYVFMVMLNSSLFTTKTMKRISSLCKLPQLYSFHTTRVVRNERFNDVYSLAVQNLFRGNYKKAEEIYYKALQMDLNDPLKFHLLSDLATVQKLMGSFSKAAENYKRALKIFSKNKKIGVESSSLAIIIINLAIVMASNGNITKAESLISQIFKMKHLDEKLFPFLEEYALVLLKLGKVKKAKEHFDKLWSLIESNNFEEYPKSYMILHHLGTCQAALGDLLPSTVSHIKALQICEEKFGSNSKEVAGSCEMVGTQYLNIGCEEEASEYFSRALEIAKDLDPKKESELLCNIHILKARIDLKRGDYMASLKTCFDAIDFEMNGNLIAKVYYYMAKCYEVWSFSFHLLYRD